MNSLINGKEAEIHEILLSPACESLDSWSNHFTAIQRQILKLMSEGRTNREIAEILEIEVAEVKREIAALLKALKDWERGAGQIIH